MPEETTTSTAHVLEKFAERRRKAHEEALRAKAFQEVRQREPELAKRGELAAASLKGPSADIDDDRMGKAMATGIQRQRVKRSGEEQSEDQDEALIQLQDVRSGIDRDSLLKRALELPKEQLANDPVLSDSRIGQYFRIELMRKDGIRVPEEHALETYRKVAEYKSKKQAQEGPQVAMEPTVAFHGVLDVPGKDLEYKSPVYRKFAYEETPEERYARIQSAVENAGTIEGALKGIDSWHPDIIAATEKSVDRNLLVTPFRGEGIEQPAKNIVIPFAMASDGTVGIDVNKIRNDLTTYYANEELRRRNVAGMHVLNETERKEVAEVARKKAWRTIETQRARGKGAVFVDLDPEETIRNLKEGRDPLSYLMGFVPGQKILLDLAESIGAIDEEGRKSISRIHAPWRALLTPGFAFTGGTDTLHYAEKVEMLREGKLSYFARIAPSTVIGAWIRAWIDDNADWGSEEHLRLIRQGYDFTDEAIPIGKAAAKALGVESKNLERVLGIGAVGAVLLVEPDLISLGSLGFGKAYKEAKLLFKTRRLIRGSEVLKTAVKLSPDTVSVFRRIAQEGFPVVADAAKKEWTSGLASSGLALRSGTEVAVKIDSMLAGIEKNQEALQKALAKSQKALTAKDARLAEEEIARLKLKDLELKALSTAYDEGTAEQALLEVMRSAGLKKAPKIDELLKLQPQMKQWEAAQGALDTLLKTEKNKKIAEYLNAIDVAKDLLEHAQKSQKGLKGAERIAKEAYKGQTYEWLQGLKKELKALDVGGEVAPKIKRVKNQINRLKEKYADTFTKVDVVTATQRLAHAQKVRQAIEKAIPKAFRQAERATGRRAKAGYIATQAAMKATKKQAEIDLLKSAPVMLNEVLQNFAKALEAHAGQLSKGSIEAFKDAGIALHGVPILDEVVKDGRVISQTIDTAEYMERLVDKYGGQMLDDYITRYGKDHRLLDIIRAKGGPVEFKVEEMLKLQNIEHRLLQEKFFKDLGDKNLLRAQLIEDAWKNPDLPLNMEMLKPKTWMPALRVALNKLKSYTDPITQRYGEWVESVTADMRANSEMHVRLKDELHELRRRSKDPIADMIRYMDTNAVFKFRNGESILNQQISTQWDDCVRYILNDGRLLGEEGLTDKNLALEALARMWLPARDFPIELAGEARKYAWDLLAGNKVKSFNEFQDVMRQWTKKRVQGVDLAVERSIAMGALAVGHGAIMNRTIFNMQRSLGGGFTPKMASDVGHILSANPEKVTDVEKMWEGFVRLGTPFNQRRVRKQLADLTGTTKELVKIGKSTRGQDAFLPANLIAEMEANSSRMIKELYAYHSGAREPSAITGAFHWFFRAWRSSVVTGLFIPNPRHWMTTFVSDANQVIVGEGPIKGVQLSFQNAFTNIPFVGRRMQDWLTLQSKKANGKPVIGSIMNALFNPHLNDIWTGKKGVIRSASGELIDLDKFRLELIEQGILDTQLHRDLLSLVGRTSGTYSRKMYGTGMKKAIQQHNHDIQMAMVSVQQRQRAALYAEKRIRQGVSAKAAQKAVFDSFYDWNNGMTQWELTYLAQISAFYRFWRLASKQVVNAFLEPLVKPTPKLLKKALIGQTSAARIRQTSLLLHALPEWVYWDDPEKKLDDLEQFRYFAKYVFPWWTETRPVFGSWPMDPNNRRYFREQQGRDFTHFSYIAPAATTQDALHLMLSGIGAITGSMAHGLWDAPVADDLVEQAAEPFLGLLLPGFQEAGETFLSSMSGTKGFWGHTDRVSVRAGEAKVLSLMGLDDIVYSDPDTGKLYMPTSAAMLFRMFPFFGTQLPQFFRAYEETPEFQRGVLAGSARMMSQLSGFRRIPMNPARTWDYDVLEKKAALAGDVREAKMRGGTKQPSPYLHRSEEER